MISELYGKRLTEFRKGDYVYRDYNGRYEQYFIEDDSKDLYKLKAIGTGYTGTWNAANNGGFILLKSLPTIQQQIQLRLF